MTQNVNKNGYKKYQVPNEAMFGKHAGVNFYAKNSKDKNLYLIKLLDQPEDKNA
tara:strand:+ start:288 stop:449 length:162 start_codon:yes stop_codon:yes gene_type:complete